MKTNAANNNAGFSLIELSIAMIVTLSLLAIISSVFTAAMGIRSRESRRADALVSAQAALNVMSREISNSGFGIFTNATTKQGSNGIILADSGASRIHFRSNFDNVGDYSVPAGSTVLATNQPGEDVTYFFDSTTNSILRYDPNAPAGVQKTSVIVNRISNVIFEYFNYTEGSSAVTSTTTPTVNTGRVRITVRVDLDPVVGQPQNQSVTFTSDVTLRNVDYMLRQY